jgi:hypothetical protein
MQIGYAIRQHVAFTSGDFLNVTTNFNHLAKGFKLWPQEPYPLQHNVPITIDK